MTAHTEREGLRVQVADLQRQIVRMRADHMAARDRALEEAAKLREERDELQMIFDLSYAAQMRAIAAWQERHDEPLTWPDHERLVLWLMEEREKLREALEEIAEEHDAGRHDGEREPCPARTAYNMWLVARAALEPKP